MLLAFSVDVGDVWAQRDPSEVPVKLFVAAGAVAKTEPPSTQF